jgi:hypothetical protein
MLEDKPRVMEECAGMVPCLIEIRMNLGGRWVAHWGFGLDFLFIVE